MDAFFQFGDEFLFRVYRILQKYARARVLRLVKITARGLYEVVFLCILYGEIVIVLLARIVVDNLGGNVIASGGIMTINNIKTLKKNGIYGAICGKSIYSGSLDLSQAVRLAK